MRRDAALADPKSEQSEKQDGRKHRAVMPLAFLLYGELREIARVSKTLCFADFGGDEGRLCLLFGEEISHSRIPRHNLRHNRCKKTAYIV